MVFSGLPDEYMLEHSLQKGMDNYDNTFCDINEMLPAAKLWNIQQTDSGHFKLIFRKYAFTGL